jgi:hypothetical protein
MSSNSLNEKRDRYPGERNIQLNSAVCTALLHYRILPFLINQPIILYLANLVNPLDMTLSDFLYFSCLL